MGLIEQLTGLKSTQKIIPFYAGQAVLIRPPRGASACLFPGKGFLPLLFAHLPAVLLQLSGVPVVVIVQIA